MKKFFVVAHDKDEQTTAFFRVTAEYSKQAMAMVNERIPDSCPGAVCALDMDELAMLVEELGKP